MREVRARECAGRRDLGRSDPVGVPAQDPRNRNAYSNACRRRFDGLMTQMADGAGISGSVGVVMPDSAERRPRAPARGAQSAVRRRQMCF